LSGLGADEQLGGYTRHKVAFRRPAAEQGEWEGLVEELQMDLDRIGSRNLGRDGEHAMPCPKCELTFSTDRVISSLGKEVRYPYLAAPVVACLASIPVHLKADYRFGNGVGDKMLLRQLARDLGLVGAAGFAKRAIQFGAKSAKMQLDKQDSKGDAILQ